MAVCACFQEKACEALELFDELLETEVTIIVPHLKPFLQFCLQVTTQGLGNCTELGGKISPAKPFQGHPKSQVRVVLEQGWSGVHLCTVMKGWVSQKWSQEMVISHQVAFHQVVSC